MSYPTPRLQPIVSRVAALRVKGVPWAQVARQVRRKAKTISNWPHVFGKFWEEVSNQARRFTAYEAADEAVQVLRKQIRGEDEGRQQGATGQLLKNRDYYAQFTEITEGTAFHRLFGLLEEMSDAELDSLVGGAPSATDARAADSAVPEKSPGSPA